MGPQNIYQQLLSDIGLVIKSFEYRRIGSNFYHYEDGNWGVINFQKSTKSNSEVIFFTINLGIASSRLLNFFSTNISSQGPSIFDCHWQKRIGHLILGEDLWWSIESDTQVKLLGAELWTYILNQGIPEIANYIHDINLRDLWLSGSSPSLTEFQRLVNLSVLLKEIGPQKLLEPTLDQLKHITAGKPTSISADIYIKRILSG